MIRMFFKTPKKYKDLLNKTHQAFRIDDLMDPMDFLNHMCSTCRGVVGPSVEKSSMVRRSLRAGSLAVCKQTNPRLI